MKKLVLSAAVAFFATASAMAQTNVDNSTQSGSNQQGITDQTGNANNNTLMQSGSGHLSDVKQDGSLNIASTTQSGSGSDTEQCIDRKPGKE